MKLQLKKQTSLEYIKEHFISVFVSDEKFHKLFEVAEAMRQIELMTAKNEAAKQFHYELMEGLSKITDNETT